LRFPKNSIGAIGVAVAVFHLNVDAGRFYTVLILIACFLAGFSGLFAAYAVVYIEESRGMIKLMDGILAVVSMVFLFEVVSRTTVAQNARKPRESDFADVLHAFFAPQVDIYRSDRFACDVLGRIPAAKRTALVGSLFDLPRVIENWCARVATDGQLARLSVAS